MAYEKKEYQVKMDGSQLEAIQDLKEKFLHWEQEDLEDDFATTGIELVAEWMDKWYVKAGYKRLARVLIMVNREGPSILDTPNLIQGE